MKFKKVHEWDTEAAWISPRQNNGDFDFWFVLRWLNLEHYEGFEHKHLATVHAVSPSQVAPKEIESMISSLGLDENDEADLRSNAREEDMAIYLVEYGTSVVMWEDTGNNRAELLKEARKEAELASMLFGFYMDRPVNMIGTTGWQMITGDLLGGLKLAEEAA